MGTMFSLLAKAIASSAISGYGAHRLLLSSSSPPLSRLAHISLAGLASLAGLTYYLKVWIQGYYFDWSYNDNRDLTGRTAVVTGGTVGGLGYAAAELLYRQGATVIITVRTKEKGEAALAKLTQSSSSDGDSGDDGSSSSRASFVLCDFLSESSVRNCAAEIKTQSSGGIDFLLLNAGISGHQQENTAKVWMTNHLGPWIFAQDLMPSLIQKAKRNPSEHPRVVWVSSGAHKKAFISWNDPFHPTGIHGYGQSKLANIMHMREYQKRVRECLRQEIQGNDDDDATKSNIGSGSADVKCFAITPGAVWTSIFPKIPLLYPLFWAVMRSPKMGAQVIKMACLDNDLKGGEYLSNCYVKESEGEDGCSNDEEQWKRLWELTAKQVEEKEYEKSMVISADKKMD
jgi:NAD(P)-dependent dehydrogenase (short-subunit alcohol dehydrogenase family)